MKTYLNKLTFIGLTILLVLLMSAVFFSPAYAQGVTVGSNNPPNKGALLDLKEKQTDDGSANSKLGLMLPRLNLVSLTGLYPVFAKKGTDGKPVMPMQDADDYDTQAKKDARHLEHTGLTVYNLTYDLSVPLCPGVYVWMSDIWVKMGELCCPSPQVTAITTVLPCIRTNTDFVLETVVNGGYDLHFQWQKWTAPGDWLDIPGQDTNTLTYQEATSGDYMYRCQVWSGCTSRQAGAVNSPTYNVSANAVGIPAPLAIDAFICYGKDATAGATAQSGERIDWYDAETGGNLILANSDTYTVTGVTAGQTIYAEAVNTTGCKSPRTEVNIFLDATRTDEVVAEDEYEESEIGSVVTLSFQLNDPDKDPSTVPELYVVNSDITPPPVKSGTRQGNGSGDGTSGSPYSYTVLLPPKPNFYIYYETNNGCAWRPVSVTVGDGSEPPTMETSTCGLVKGPGNTVAWTQCEWNGDEGCGCPLMLKQYSQEGLLLQIDIVWLSDVPKDETRALKLLDKSSGTVRDMLMSDFLPDADYVQLALAESFTSGLIGIDYGAWNNPINPATFSSYVISWLKGEIQAGLTHQATSSNLGAWSVTDGSDNFVWEACNKETNIMDGNANTIASNELIDIVNSISPYNTKYWTSHALVKYYDVNGGFIWLIGSGYSDVDMNAMGFAWAPDMFDDWWKKVYSTFDYAGSTPSYGSAVTFSDIWNTWGNYPGRQELLLPPNWLTGRLISNYMLKSMGQSKGGCQLNLFLSTKNNTTLRKIW